MIHSMKWMCIILDYVLVGKLDFFMWDCTEDQQSLSFNGCDGIVVVQTHTKGCATIKTSSLCHVGNNAVNVCRRINAKSVQREKWEWRSQFGYDFQYIHEEFFTFVRVID